MVCVCCPLAISHDIGGKSRSRQHKGEGTPGIPSLRNTGQRGWNRTTLSKPSFPPPAKQQRISRLKLVIDFKAVRLPLSFKKLLLYLPPCLCSASQCNTLSSRHQQWAGGFGMQSWVSWMLCSLVLQLKDHHAGLILIKVCMTFFIMLLILRDTCKGSALNYAIHIVLMKSVSTNTGKQFFPSACSLCSCCAH